MKEEILKYILTLELYDKQLAVDALWEKIAEESADQKSEEENVGEVKEPEEKYRNRNSGLESWEEFKEVLISVNKKIFNEILNLPFNEKILLAQDVWNGIREEIQEEDIDDDILKMLNERHEEYKRNPKSARSWEDVKRDFLNRK